MLNQGLMSANDAYVNEVFCETCLHQWGPVAYWGT
jgi:hypothetical protein